MDTGLNIYVSTCDSHLPLIKPFYYLFNKFWGTDQKVTILGYSEPSFELPSNFDFISMGEKQIDIEHWSTDLRNFFESIDDEYFIYTVEDSFLLCPVNFETMYQLFPYTKYKNFGRAVLTSDIPSRANTDGGGYDILEKIDNGQYKYEMRNSTW